MAKKIRVHQLAKELELSNKEMLLMLQNEGIKATSHLSVLEDDLAALVREHAADQKAAKADDEPDAPVETADKPPEPEAAETQAAETQADEAEAGQTDTADTADTAAAEDAAQDKNDDMTEDPPVAAGVEKELHLKQPIIVKDLAQVLELKPNVLIHELMSMNLFATINESLDPKIATAICKNHGFILIAEKREKPAAAKKKDVPDPEDVIPENAEVVPRPPIVTLLGHVDHGKTSLLDKIRTADVAGGETGGITQHIGAWSIDWNGKPITFIDTPGHEAFTAMRARGASTTDIVVLVVAADDGFMPQTDEALSHAKAAGVPIVVAINKIDLPGAKPDQVIAQMQQRSLQPEDLGGDVGVVQVSAMTGAGIDGLLERLLLEAEVLELKCNPDLPARATVLEAQLETGHGPTVNLLINNGTLRLGDTVLCGRFSGKVKALIDSNGSAVKTSGPSSAVKLGGIGGIPDSGTTLVACVDVRLAKRLAEERSTQLKQNVLQGDRMETLNNFLSGAGPGRELKELKLILKADVHGTCEAAVDALTKLAADSDKVNIDIVQTGIGGIAESDVLLAATSKAELIGFRVRVNPGVNAVAKKNNVEIRLYGVIYELIETIRAQLTDMIDPEMVEESLGKAEILQVFHLSKLGKISGCGVTEGVIQSNALARVFRDSDLIYNGRIQSLKRFQDDVKEVRLGMECGIRLDNFSDFETGDIIEIYRFNEVPVAL